MAPRVFCPHCGEGRLAWSETSENGEGHYICENWAQFDPGIECRQPLTEEEYKELVAEAREASPKRARASGNGVAKANLPVVGNIRGTKEVNVAALQSGDLIVKRQPLLPKVLSVSDEDPVIKKQFKSPVPGASATSSELLKRLSASRRFVPWGCREPFRPLQGNLIEDSQPVKEEEKCEVHELPPGIEPLVLWQPEEDPAHATDKSKPIIVDPHLTRFLRAHQREGVQFMFECVAGLRDFCRPDEEGQSCCGCILADDMGLGKTLQSITLLWTLLQQGFNGAPMARRAMVVTPTSLVSNWEAEIKKWLENRVKVMALCESTRADVMLGITNFLARGSLYRVLIISYETFRIHATRLQQAGSCDLLICDEAHRLKNDRTLTNQALAGLPCRRRVLLSGTPMQNDLEEFYAMVNFTNPGILGDATAFRRYFEAPILTGREPDATDSERTVSTERSNELSDKVNQFILRRTNALLSNHLPPKIVQVVCCKLTDLQIKLYNHFIASKKVKKVLEDNSKRSQVLASITALKKLCNHPKLIYDTMKAGGAEAAGFEDCLNLFPPAVLSSRNGTWTGGEGLWIELSGKMSVLARLLSLLRRTTNDRIVLVSNYTQTLDLFGQICRERGYPFIRLDGSTGIGKRQKLVQRFNDPTQDEFAFLLSSKAGGCGLNLIGGNRLVLFDPDWNPANDKQAAARVWRDGQKKRVFIYRFLSTGTIEEKVYQRQMSKEGLQKVVDNEKATEAKAQVNLLSSEDLRDLFTLRDTTPSDTHDTLSCKRCPTEGDKKDALGCLLDAAATMANGPEPEGGNKGKPAEGLDGPSDDIGKFAEVAGVADKLKLWHRQVGTPLEEELQDWGHHSSASTIPDAIMQRAGAELVSFIFSCQIDGKLTPQDSSVPSGLQRPGNRQPLHGASAGLRPPGTASRPLVRTAGPGALGLSPGLASGVKAAGLQARPAGSMQPTLAGVESGNEQARGANSAAGSRVLEKATPASKATGDKKPMGDVTETGKRKRSGLGTKGAARAAVPNLRAAQAAASAAAENPAADSAILAKASAGPVRSRASAASPAASKGANAAVRERRTASGAPPDPGASTGLPSHASNAARDAKSRAPPSSEAVAAAGLSRAAPSGTGSEGGAALVNSSARQTRTTRSTPAKGRPEKRPEAEGKALRSKPELIALDSDSEQEDESENSDGSSYAGSLDNDDGDDEE